MTDRDVSDLSFMFIVASSAFAEFRALLSCRKCLHFPKINHSKVYVKSYYTFVYLYVFATRMLNMIIHLIRMYIYILFFKIMQKIMVIFNLNILHCVTFITFPINLLRMFLCTYTYRIQFQIVLYV